MAMNVLRPVRAGEESALLPLASKIAGLTTLPPDEEVLARKVEQSVASFARTSPSPGEDYFLFVLEDGATGRIIGTSGVYAAVGTQVPFYNYRLLHLTQLSTQPAKKVDTKLLQLVNDYAGATELATLFLDPEHQGGGNGSILSRGRYLMMAAQPSRFSDRVFAEIRGWLDDDGRSPFWEAIGRHFFNMDFIAADRINGMGNSQFIADLMPKFPIYTSLLPQMAQDVIGRPHDGARGAVRLLQAEGFRFAGAVDIFDAGPVLEAPRDQLHSIRNTRHLSVVVRPTLTDAVSRLLCNPDINHFRIVRASVVVEGDEAHITNEAADALGLSAGDRILVAPEKKRS